MHRGLTKNEQTIYTSLSEKLPLKEIENIKSFVFIKGNKTYNIRDPVIFSVAGTDGYLVLGGVEQGIEVGMLKKYLEQLKLQKESIKEKANVLELVDDEETIDVEEYIKDIPVADPKIKKEDIEIIMRETNVTEDVAIAELKKNNYDVLMTLLSCSK